MRSLFCVRLALGVLLTAVLIGLPLPARAEPAKADPAKKPAEKAGEASGESEKVKFETVDQVTLVGNFYASDKGKKSPCVILLHSLGGDIKQDGWDRLATDLQKKGFAVLAFDFRGHGNSTSVEPAFWMAKQNLNIRGGGPGSKKGTISFKDFPANYYPRLVDDIVAAKLFLDRKNDAGECNSSSLIVIGAEDGFALGAMWMASEFNRHRIIGQPALIGPRKFDQTPEGKNEFVAAVWLSIKPQIHTQTVPVKDWLKTIGGKDNKVPMYFLYGAKDQTAETFAGNCDTAVKAGDAKLALTGKKGIKDTKLAGNALLGKSLETVETITNYLDKVIKEHGPGDWNKQEVEKVGFIWNFNNQAVIAKQEGEKNILPLPVAALLSR